MNARLIRLTVAAVTLILLAAATAGAQSGCELPLFIQSGTVDANVMILFDNSGSMNEAMTHPAFNSFTTYAGQFVRNTTYYIATDGNYTPKTVPGRPAAASQTTPSVYLVDSFNNQDGRYRGNYLNWLFYTATAAQRLALAPPNAQPCRIDVAHAVVSDIITRSSHVRFGLTRFNFETGGTIVANCGTSKTTLINTVNTIQADAWTPLGEALETILNYYKRTDSTAPIIAPCQKNFIIVMTDGFPTKDRGVSTYLHDADHDGHDPGTCVSIGSPDDNTNDCSDHMDDVAYYMFNNDLRSDLGSSGNNEVQNVVTYTVGFGVDAHLLSDTAENGDGQYYRAENAADLWTSLELVMLDIISRISTGAAVAVVSTERGTDEMLYRGKFMPGSWNGYLEAFDLPYIDGESPVWEAGYRLAAAGPSGRQIWTALGATTINFTSGEAAALQSAMGVATPEIAADIINWTRGESVANYRERNDWILGDIIHSTPVVVGAPAGFADDPDYQAFLAANATRTRMLYVGANDGMLHAFEAASGDEAWAFVPETALPKLATIADTSYCHTYTVDLTPSVEDVLYSNTWHTVLVGGGREGGCGYFALDVTAPGSPQLLWQASLPNNKPFSSEVEFATINDTAVALIGSGLDETTGRAYLETYRVADGVHLGSILLSSNAGARNKATGARVVDLDLDGNHDLAYIGDLQGHVWRVAFGGSDNPSDWDVTCLWSGSYQVTATPAPAHGEGGNVLVYFGTGAYLDSPDIATTEQNIFCCVYDRQDGAENAVLVDQTNAIHEIGVNDDGWYVRVEHANGERVTEPAVVVAGVVLFTSFLPSSQLCAAGGTSWLWRMSFTDGSVPDDGEGDNWGGGRSIELGEGIASRPVVDVVNETVIVQSSDASITVQDIGQSFFRLTVRSWRETFDGANP
jgi:type IV pilus assembly protein PilY1